MELVARDKLSEFEEPGEEALDLPTPPVATEVAAVLGEDLSAGVADEFGQPRIARLRARLAARIGKRR